MMNWILFFFVLFVFLLLISIEAPLSGMIRMGVSISAELEGVPDTYTELYIYKSSDSNGNWKYLDSHGHAGNGEK